MNPSSVTSVSKPVGSPGNMQGWALVATAWLSVAAATVISPILPKMTAYYSAGLDRSSNVTTLIALVATLPALFVALFAAPVGMLADRLGRLRILLGGLVLYGVFGIAPLWLPQLWQIVGARIGVGIAEAIIITCGTAMLGDYFKGERRETWFAIQTGTANLSAVFLVLLGGLLGEHSWRIPFGVYGISFVLIPIVYFATRNVVANPASEETILAETVKGQPVWRSLWPICLMTAFASSAFFVMVIQQSFLLTDRGFSSPRLIGISGAAITLAVPLGSILFRVLKISIRAKLILSFILSSAGFTVIALTDHYVPFLIGGMINGLGSGIVLPTLITWALSKLSDATRGLGTGLWQSALFLGQFLSPLTVILIGAYFHGRNGAVSLYAVACALAAMFLLRNNAAETISAKSVHLPGQTQT